MALATIINWQRIHINVYGRDNWSKLQPLIKLVPFRFAYMYLLCIRSAIGIHYTHYTYIRWKLLTDYLICMTTGGRSHINNNNNNRKLVYKVVILFFICVIWWAFLFVCLFVFHALIKKASIEFDYIMRVECEKPFWSIWLCSQVVFMLKWCSSQRIFVCSTCCWWCCCSWREYSYEVFCIQK